MPLDDLGDYSTVWLHYNVLILEESLFLASVKQNSFPVSGRIYNGIMQKYFDIEGLQMRREMSSDSEDSYISELSDSDHEERKVEEEESSVRIASSVCGTNVTSQIKSRGILTARFEYNFWDKMAQLQALINSSALIQNMSKFEIVYFKLYIFQP